MRNAFVVALLVGLAASRAQAAPLDDILAKNLTARGGEAKLRAVRSLRLTGKVIFGGTDFSLEAAWGQVQARSGPSGASSGGAMMRMETTVQGLTQIAAYDGRDGWTVSPFGGRIDAETASSDDARSLAQQAEIDGPLVDWRGKGHRIEYLGTEDTDGTPAIKLRVTRKDGDVQFVFLDPDSMLEMRIRTVHKSRGAEQISETDLGGYQQIDGVWLPFSIESGSPGGPRTARVVVERAEINVATEPAWFKLPPPKLRVAAVVVAGPPDNKAAAAIAAPPAPPGHAIADSGTISGLGARNIGSATMSGRISAVAARIVDGKTLLYIGAASGGVWKSQDGGTTFKPVFDKQPVQSIGAIAIDPADARTVWVGTGEAWTRNSVSIGDGIYKSTDGGDTWTNMGLPNAERITKIAIDPRASATVYACVPGKLWSDSNDRGLYKTSDGGKTWALVLHGANASTGCSAITIDPRNSNHLLAGLWDFRRKGWTFRSGGEGPDAASGSGMFESSDGGKTWRSLAQAKGLPTGPWGRVEVVFAPSDSRIVYALVESKASALYRSADGGATWEARDSSQMMVWRPFYFARLVVDPTNPNRLFKPDLRLIVSEDGGRSFSDTGGGAHGDWHDLWIDPSNPKHVIGGDDGGLWLSYDGGNRWWKSQNLPISQFYHVAVDNRDPYQVYGGLQDNSSWVGDSSYPGGITNARWENLYGGDGFWTVPDPNDPDFVYAEAQGGTIGRVNRKTLTSRDIQPRAGYKEKLRFNWNTPIYASPTQKGTIYIGAQFLFRSRDRGDTWDRVSPDLTTNDPEKQKQEQSGGITIDNSSAEMHTTIFSISESPKNANVLWVGTDDGNLQLSRDGARTWSNVVGNVPGLAKGSWVNWVEASRFDPAVAYAAFDRHTFGDMTPYVYRTGDYGKTWTRIVTPEQGVRGYAFVIKEDTVKKDLLFLGTELGLWISLDGGKAWAKFKGGDLPDVAVRDLQIQPRDGDLVLATHGRGLWIVDDISPLRALSDAALQKPTAFLPIRPIQQRLNGGGGWPEGDATFAGDSAPGAAMITYYLRTRHVFGPIKLEVFDDHGKLLDTVTPSKRRGINRIAWTMRIKPPKVPRAASVAFGASSGPRVAPGTYTFRLTRGSEVIEQKLAIGLDRRAPYSVDDRKAQLAAVMKAHALFGEMTELVGKIEGAQEALRERIKAVPAQDALAPRLRALLDRVDATRKLIVATTEGGAITGEERIREHLDQVYGAMNNWEGRPAAYQLAAVEALRKELGDAGKQLADITGKDWRALDDELKRLKLEPLPQLSQLEHDDELDDVAMHCVATAGRDCGEAERAAQERD